MTQRYKYPRTPHLSWSPGASSDDEQLSTGNHFEGHEVVVTEKMDGENTSLYTAGQHARSLSSGPHPSRTWVKALHARVAPQIPEGWRLCGENVYARHSVAYSDLPGYFLLFSVWDEENRCLSWDETVVWAELLELPTVPVLWRGLWDEARLRRLADELDTTRCEGFVVRTAAGFAFADFRQHVAKWVRAGHVQTSEHWMHQAVIPNGVRQGVVP